MSTFTSLILHIGDSANTLLSHRIESWDGELEKRDVKQVDSNKWRWIFCFCNCECITSVNLTMLCHAYCSRNFHILSQPSLKLTRLTSTHSVGSSRLFAICCPKNAVLSTNICQYDTILNTNDSECTLHDQEHFAISDCVPGADRFLTNNLCLSSAQTLRQRRLYRAKIGLSTRLFGSTVTFELISNTLIYCNHSVFLPHNRGVETNAVCQKCLERAG